MHLEIYEHVLCAVLYLISTFLWRNKLHKAIHNPGHSIVFTSDNEKCRMST